MSFDSLGLNPDILRAVAEQGYVEPTPIQQQAIPAVMQGRDLMASAQTGTGKTAGFTLPLLQRLIDKEPHAKGRRPVRALILTPTRELAAQVGENVRDYSKYLNIRSLVVFGGVSINPQMMKLRGGVDILVATPGRLLDLEHQNAVSLDSVEILVLDEADRMLDMGFIHDIRRVLAKLPARRQNLLFSATFSDEIKGLAEKLLHNPLEVEVARRNTASEQITQHVHFVDKNRKRELLSQLIGEGNWQQVLVFTRTKHGANHLAEQLNKDGIRSAAIHGNKSQGARTRALADFKSGGIRVLVATDIAARGLDIEELPHVVNYELPNVPEDYVHRIGRTGRAGRAGRALLFVENRERRLLRNIERTMKLTIPEVELPNAELLGKRRLEKFAAKVQQQLESSDLDQYRALLAKIQPTAEGEELDVETLAAALLKMAQGERSLIVPPDAPMRPKREFRDRDDRFERRGDRNDRGPRGDREDRPKRERRDVGEMELYRIEVGRDDGVEVRHIVGAIANEGDISSRYIGNIKLFGSHSTIELPKGMPGEVLQHYTRTRILNKPMNMQLMGDAQPRTERRGGGERREGGRGFGGERREGGRSFGGERREGGRGDGRRFSGERREGRAPRRDDAAAPRRDDSAGRRRFGGDA